MMAQYFNKHKFFPSDETFLTPLVGRPPLGTNIHRPPPQTAQSFQLYLGWVLLLLALCFISLGGACAL